MPFFSHITLGTNDMERARTFYKAVLTTIGIDDCREYPDVGFVTFAGAPGQHSELLLCKPIDGKPATVGNGLTIGFEAQTRAQVDAFYEAAMKMGATDEGGPGLRPHYHKDFYGAYVRDLDGHKLCCNCQKPE